MTLGTLASLFKAYDVRGTVPDQLNAQRARAVGVGFGRFCQRAEPASTQVVVGRDMRSSSEELAAAYIEGVRSTGLSVIDIGLCSTDLLYFASGRLASPGTMLTASHNPAAYNGMKFCLSSARPIGEESGLREVRDLAEQALGEVKAAPTGAYERRELPEDFALHVRSFVDPRALEGLRVVADTANGMGGLVAPAVFSALPCRFDLLYGELDGSFPHHPADPIQPENLRDLAAAVRAGHADVGLAFDGDADRVFLVDETGEPLSGSTTTAIVARAMLARHPGATVLYNCICSHAVAEEIARDGGVGVRTRVGHSFIKQVMAETGAVFGGEHSGHYYFAANYRADSGIIAALLVLEALGRAGEPLSKLRRPFEPYWSSGEVNSEVAEPAQTLTAVQRHYERAGARLDHLDGLTVEFDDWWFNLRPSNTEPLLRLNVEAPEEASGRAHVAEVLAFVRGEKA